MTKNSEVNEKVLENDDVNPEVGGGSATDQNVPVDEILDEATPLKATSKGISKKGKGSTKRNEAIALNESRKHIEAVTGVSVAKIQDKDLAIPAGIADYIVKMKPTVKLSDLDGVANQKKLRLTFIRLLDVHPEQFKETMDWVITAIRTSREGNGAFGDKYIMRFTSLLDLLPSQLNLYKRLLNLFLTTSDVGNKKLVGRRVDISYIVNSIAGPENQNKILRYYS